MSNDDGKFKVEISLEELRKRKLFVGLPLYGGICHGSFMRGMSDLSSLCRQHGIEMMMHILMNESLIPRARNYCCDEFMRSECTHMIFIDSDIGFKANDVIGLLAMMSDDSPYDVVGGAYPKKSLPYDAKVLTENGNVSIGELVRNKYSGKVLTIDENGMTNWNKVIQHHHNPNQNKWVKVEFSNARRAKNMIMTNDHEISFVEDLLRPKISYRRVDEMMGQYTAVRPENTKMQPLYNKDVVSAMIGTLLGDSSISKKENRLSCGHGNSQKEYLNFKQMLFGGKIQTHKNNGYGKENKDSLCHILTVPVNAQTKKSRELFYSGEKKSVKNIVEYIDDIAIAMWYMDDGCLKKSGNTANYCEFNTQGFFDEDQEILVKFFKDKYGFEVRIDEMRAEAKSKTDKVFKRLRLLNGDSDKLFGIIAKYIPECMEYKIPEQYRGFEKHKFNTSNLDFSVLPICNIERIELDSDQYDIGVENNHNFVSSSVHIANCISWEKIKSAVDKGFADENPDNLRKFVGDYVFNPTGDTKSFNINQPVEVLETGTGFMMIRKKTFQNFQTAFPSAWYRPDHVRTEHFDGTRMVMAYFDCIIDRGFGWDDALNLLTDVANKNGTADELAARSQKLTEITKNASMRYLSEDYKFCQDVRKAGMKVWLAPWVELEHTGSYVFGGSLRDLAALGSSPTADPGLLAKFKGKT
tara:strand:- start:4949 stop:7033 length:2085 start_codon:yes stop_codon:yes gene_type:complete